MNAPEFSLPQDFPKSQAEIGLVLGSGLGGFVDQLEESTAVDFSEIKGLPISAVEGHAGKLHLGQLGETPVAVAQGRVHLYEGWSAREVASTIRLFHEMGIKTVLLTNAAGIVNANFNPGRWMVISDHLNLARQSPLTGGPHFIDQSEVYSRELRELLLAEAADREELSLHQGVYAWVNGPEYETPAEVRMLRQLGADAVGMSTVPEAIQARALGMRVIALSCLTNYGAGLSQQPLHHEEVIEVGKRAAQDLFSLLESVVPAMVEI
ncbi:MAG: purine-nucleoside phosphorylase [Verrucomicrobiales bacterium]|jgi:purine-nucleoside phosphorylase|nr:purine-nucleoside phosphorylase [Verrucomicrobiales bacterium]